ncbi:hypothetical protein O0I10_007048 [Lichtheimia ornata]|uniref:Arrestin C-terminal-like domain-containing protein n=1 Tax=Lichtheimia ornata TaxID=688661 RepID=A0AAD7Y0I5_9FUNG|nr:uncharacterized protein O0I10_007048 [Lichtheimia ornata]KAJ8657232.1 hypothetical protein O0I10_007048 [Lichtheimia ornata]
MTYHHDKYKSPLRIWLPDNGQLITYQDEPISFRGSLSLKCRQARIKAVTVKLEGKMKVHWSQDGINFKDEKTVYEKKWDLMRTSTKHCVHVHGTQEWDFIAELPSDLPASLNVSDGRHCEIVYRIKAVVERPTFLPNFVAKRTIHVSRYLRRASIVPTINNHNQVAVASPAYYDGSQDQWMDYTIRLRGGTVWRPGSTVPIEFNIHRVKRDVTKIRSVTCCLKSYTTLTAKGRHVRKWSWPLMYLRDDHLVRHGTPLPWRKTEYCKIPNHVAADMATSMIHIKHKLKITITLLRDNGATAEVKTSFPVIVNHMDEPIPIGNELDDYEEDPILPSYEVACGSPPYDSFLFGLPSTPPDDTALCSPLSISPSPPVPLYNDLVTEPATPHESCVLPAYDSIVRPR